MAAAAGDKLRPAKLPVAGVSISATSYSEVVEFCRQCVSERRAREGQVGQASLPVHRQTDDNRDEDRPGGLSHSDLASYICVTSVHGVITAREDGEFRRILNAADIATPDGMPLVWALRSFGARGQQRVYGPELMLHLCEDAARLGHRIFLYGGREESLKELVRRLRAKFPQLQIAGACSPPFRPLTPEEDRADVERIKASDADIVLVGISTPKQERWMYAHRRSLPGIVMIGVGAAFDFHSGRVRQAPAWMRSHGLEWLFRLTMEPLRLWRRYLLVTPRFLPLWGMELLAHARFTHNLAGHRTGAAR